MSFGSTPTTTTETPPAPNQIFISSVAVPNTANGNLTALEGGPASTDNNGNSTAPASMYVKDGGDVTQGAKADTAITDSTTTNTKMSFLKGLVKIFADIWDSVNHRIKVDGSGVTQPVSGTFWQTTQPVSGTITANAGTNLNTSALALDASVNGVLVSQGSTTSGEKGPLVQGAVTTSAPSYTTAQTSPISLTTAGAVRVDGSAVTQPVSGTFWQATQPVSGTITANAGTNLNTSALALDTSVNGVLVSQGSATSGEKGPLVQGAVTTSAPSYTTAQTSPISLTTAGAVRTDSSATTQPVSGTVTANQGGSNWSANVAQIGGNSVVTGGANGLLAVGGPVASGSSNADNPVKAGGVFNTTQPTVTNGQIVDAQYSARGAAIVATGTDTFNATINAALPAGGNTIGAVTQASGPWTENLTQIAGNPISTAATGVQKVGIVGNGGATVDSTVAPGSAPTNQVVIGSVYNSSAPAPTNGQAMALQADQAGNIREFPGIALATLAAWNSSTSLNATQTIFTNSGAAAVLVQLTQTTTLTAGAVTFEVSYDGTNWGTIPANCVLDPTSATFAQISLPYTLQANTNKAILLNMNGAQALRIKLSTQISGTGTVTPNYALLPLSPAGTVIALSPTAANFNVTASASGNFNNASVGTDGSAIPGSSTLIGASDGTNLQQLLVESSSNRNLRAALYNAGNELSIDSNGVIKALLEVVSGTALAADQSNTELRVSNYIKTTTAGDTALTAGQATMANSIPVTNASDQTPLTTATATRSNVASAASDTSLLASNTSRKGAIFFNDSTAILYLAYGSGAASTSSYSVQIPANGYFELPPAPVYTGAVRGIWASANGNVRITEMS